MEPLTQLSQQGATVHVCSPSESRKPGFITGWHEGDWAKTLNIDIPLETATSTDYDALILPGGQINPDVLRTDPKAIALIRSFYESGKPIAAICHAAWLLAEAGLARGTKLTSYQSIKTDMVNAGAHWEDSAVVTDQGLITSRSPEDLPAFIQKIVEEVQEGRHSQRQAAA